jgi:hypothetical protein
MLATLAMSLHLIVTQVAIPPTPEPPTDVVRVLMKEIDAFYKARWPDATYTPGQVVQTSLNDRAPDGTTRQERLARLERGRDCYWYLALDNLAMRAMRRVRPGTTEYNEAGSFSSHINRARHGGREVPGVGAQRTPENDQCNGPGGTAALTEWVAFSSNWASVFDLTQAVVQRGAKAPCSIAQAQADLNRAMLVNGPAMSGFGPPVAPTIVFSTSQQAATAGAMTLGASACASVSWEMVLIWLLESPAAYQSALQAAGR